MSLLAGCAILLAASASLSATGCAGCYEPTLVPIHEGLYTGAYARQQATSFPHGVVGTTLGASSPEYSGAGDDSGGSPSNGGSLSSGGAAGWGAAAGADGQGGADAPSASDRPLVGWIASARIVVDRAEREVVRSYVDADGRQVTERWRFVEEGR